MIVLGLTDSKPSTAAILVDGRVVSAISEERLTRLKMANGTPRQAIQRVIDESGLTAADIDVIAIAQHALPYRPVAEPWDGWLGNGLEGEHRSLTSLGSALAPIVGASPLAWQAHHALKRLVHRDRNVRLPRLLKDEYGLQAPVRFYDHHFCHATSAYYMSGLEEALVITLDGGGDGRSGSVYLGRGGRLRPLASVDSFNSLGNFYSYITALCGFKAELHEGKVTGLAALGEPLYIEVLRDFVRYHEPGQMRYGVPIYHESAIRRIRAALPQPFDRAALAASVQQVLEEVGTAFVRYWLRQTGQTKVAVAGGVFANVRFNQRVHDLDGVEALSIHPAMDDSGLAVGAALAACAEQRQTDGLALIHTLPNVYFGPEYSDQSIEAAVARAGYPAQHDPNIQSTIAALLAQGCVVARFTGRMEYGPRALGHRSILYQTTDPSINDWLNKNLQRTEFMPFAPATLTEHAHRCYRRLQGAEDPARFMTITFDCTDEMKAASPGVVHVDGTARPQLIDRETAPDFYKILTAYCERTGIPSLINTSFNMHGEPIVCSPEDALRSFNQGNLQYLAIGNWLVSHPSAAAQSHREPKAAWHAG
jgi:carbamoyltransferase